ncbi:MAG: hypothetical protein ABIK09_06405 [Pseudomonadota bacterium]
MSEDKRPKDRPPAPQTGDEDGAPEVLSFVHPELEIYVAREPPSPGLPRLKVDGEETRYEKIREDVGGVSVCVCDNVCTCNLVASCSCVGHSSGGGGGGGGVWICTCDKISTSY